MQYMKGSRKQKKYFQVRELYSTKTYMSTDLISTRGYEIKQIHQLYIKMFGYTIAVVFDVHICVR